MKKCNRREFLKTASIVSIAGVTVVSLPLSLLTGCNTQKPQKPQKSAKGLVGIAEPYLGNDVIIASLDQLASAGIVASGANFIQDADAMHGSDIIIANGKIAIAVSVGTPDPWGYPVGAALDMAEVTGVVGENLVESFKKGQLKVGDDRLWDMRLLMNSWDSWSPSNCGTPTYSIIKNYKFDDASEPTTALKVTLEYKETAPNDSDPFTKPLIIDTYYSLASDDDFIKVKSAITNNSDRTYKGRASGYNFSSKGTSLCSPGVALYDEDSQKSLNDMIVIYNPKYTNGLIVPGIENVYVGTGYADSYSTYTYKPNTTTEIVAYMRTDSARDISNTTKQMLDVKGVPEEKRIMVSGTIVDDKGAPIRNGIIAVEKKSGGKWSFVTWAEADSKGAYSILLLKPESLSDYRLYGMESTYAITPDAEKLTLEGAVTAGALVNYTANPLELKKTVPIKLNIVDQNGKPLYAKARIVGIKRNVVDYIANNLFYSDLNAKGIVEVLVAPGNFELEVSSGIDFFAKTALIKGNTDTNTEINVVLESVSDLREQGWYNSDLHHHVNKSDACTTPENYLKSNLAAGINVVYTSDHDDASANEDVATLLKDNKLDLVHVPGVEISASWSHFNVVPKTEAARNYMLDVSAANGGKYKFNQYDDFKNIVDSVHKKDMLFIVNHPWISYGLFYAQDLNNVPGGYYDEYDLIEINAAVKDATNVKTLASARERWTKALTGGKKYFITGSSDTHDVLKTESTYTGLARTFVKVGDNANLLNDFATQLGVGNSYVSYGPLMFPVNEQMFGDTFNVTSGSDFTISLPVQSINGLAKVEIYDQSGLVSEKIYGNEIESTFEASVKPTKNNWYQIVVTDKMGKQALSNPYFINIA